jgi:type I restriction enzyme S subunit
MSDKGIADSEERQKYEGTLHSLPHSWCWTTVEDISIVVRGGSPRPAGDPRYFGGPVPWITVGSLTADEQPYLRNTTEGLTEAGKERSRWIDPDTLLLTNSGATLGVPKITMIGGCINDGSVALLHVDHPLKLYLYYFLKSKTKHLRSINQGAAQPNLNTGIVKAIAVPLPPMNEQKRIATKIEELFSDLDAGVTALKRAKANLKRYRAAVLKAAVEGKLTEEWRAKHPAKEPASALLARILKERRQKWEADQLAKFAAADKEPPKNWKEKYVEPLQPVTTGLPELPANWCWASVQQVGSVQLGRQRSPQHHSGDHMRPYLRVANVFEDRIDISDVMEMNFTPNEFETYRLGYGDILLNEGQSMELIGRPAIYRDEVPGACFTNTLVRFRVYDGVDTDYALRVFLAYLKNGRFQKIATITVNIAHLGAGRFSEIEFPLPPVEEQAAIIDEVDSHFSLIDAAEKAINLSLARASRLRQSILKQAFEGKLVPQDPTDQPASVLLERLRASRSVHEGNGKAARPTRGRRAKSKQADGSAPE